MTKSILRLTLLQYSSQPNALITRKVAEDGLDEQRFLPDRSPLFW